MLMMVQGLCKPSAMELVPIAEGFDSLPFWATGVFRAATDVAAAPQRGANPHSRRRARRGVGSVLALAKILSKRKDTTGGVPKVRTYQNLLISFKNYPFISAISNSTASVVLHISAANSLSWWKRA